MKIHLIIITTLFLFSGCSDDVNKPVTDTFNLYGKWEVTSESDSRYYIFKTNNTWYELQEYRGISRRILSGVCTITKTQVDVGSIIWNYSIAGNQLTLTNVDKKITAVRNDSIPEETEWIKSPAILDSIVSFNFGSGDITSDGTNIWVPRGHYLLKVKPHTADTAGMYFSLPFYTYAVEWDGMSLWCHDDDQKKIKKINPADGSILFISRELPDYIRGIAFDGSSFWLSGYYPSPTYKYDPVSNSIVDSLPNFNEGALAFGRGHLYYIASGNIHKASLNPFNVVTAYEIPGRYLYGIAFDGTDFWVSTSNTLYKVKLD